MPRGKLSAALTELLRKSHKARLRVLEEWGAGAESVG